MSNLSAALNSLSSSSMMDFYLQRHPGVDNRPNCGSRGSRRFSGRWFCSLSPFCPCTKSSRVIEVGLTIASVAYGALLGVFLLGVLTKRANRTRLDGRNAVRLRRRTLLVAGDQSTLDLVCGNRDRGDVCDRIRGKPADQGIRKNCRLAEPSAPRSHLNSLPAKLLKTRLGELSASKTPRRHFPGCPLLAFSAPWRVFGCDAEA